MRATRQTLRRIALVTCLLVAGAAATTAAPAVADSSPACWKKLITDWYDGRIDHSYPIHCYRDALHHLPQDVKTYSDAYDVISRALASATRDKKKVDQNAVVPPPPAPPSDGGGGGASGGSGPAAPAGGTGAGHAPPKGGAAPPKNSGSGFLNDAVGKMGSDSADSVPVPLLVLAGLAILLVAAGAIGLVARRVQGRGNRA